MGPNIYQYFSYRLYLKDRLEHLGPRSGLKRRAAEALGVHTTFISQVVLGKAELSLDQAEKFNDFLGHNDTESEYFLDLVIFERASEKGLRKRFETKLKKIQGEHLHIKKRLDNTREIAAEDQERFYSSHIFGLIHVLASIPKLQKRERLIEATGYPPEIVSSAIDFLLHLGVLKQVKEMIVPGEQHVHLSHDAKLIRQHHANWRTATVQQLSFARPSDLHYSLTFSCAEKDAVKIRESLLKHLEELTKAVGASKEEQVYVYCFDFFRWT